MRKYFGSVINNLISPPSIMSRKFLSIQRYLNKRKMLKQLMTAFKYNNEEQLSNDIQIIYASLYEALRQKDNSMILRYLSIDLYEEYEREEVIFQLKERISDISIYDCLKVKRQQTQDQWFHLNLKIKHFNSQDWYVVQRKIYAQNYKFNQNFIKTWYFRSIPSLESIDQNQAINKPNS